MPYSLDIYNNDVVNIIKQVKPATMLDIGPCDGKYLNIAREAIPNIVADCVEPGVEWIEKHNLLDKYRKVFAETAEVFFKKDLYSKYDLITMGDVIEHMYLNDAISVIDAACYKSKFILLIWPTNLPQDEEHGRELEMHKSNIYLSDLTRFNIQFYNKTFFGNNRGGTPSYMHLALIAGHLTNPHNEASVEILQ